MKNNSIRKKVIEMSEINVKRYNCELLTDIERDNDIWM